MTALSAFLPWVSAFGIASASPHGGGLLVLLALGGALGFLGAQVLRNKATKVVRVLTWVLAGINTLAVLGFFAALKAVDQTTGPFGVDVGEIVHPASGFYLALMALIASVVGTIMLQTVKSTSAQATVGTSSAPGVASPQPQPTRLSTVTPVAQPDAEFWFDGTTWRPIAQTMPKQSSAA